MVKSSNAWGGGAENYLDSAAKICSYYLSNPILYIDTMEF